MVAVIFEETRTSAFAVLMAHLVCGGAYQTSDNDLVVVHTF